MIEFRPATVQDFIEFTGKEPPLSSIAYAIIYNGELAALFGRTLEKGHSVVYSHMKPDVKASKALIAKTAMKALSKITGTKFPLYAIRNKDLCNSERFLRFLGFEKTRQEGVFKYEVTEWK